MTTIKEIHGYRHYYIDDGNSEPFWAPSVTSVISCVKGSKYRHGKGGKALSAAERGTALHSLVEARLNNQPLPAIHPEVEPFWESIKPVLRQIDKALFVERFVWHSGLKYAGTMDALVQWGDRFMVLDFKTTSTLKNLRSQRYGYRLQLAAYSRAASCLGLSIKDAAMIVAHPDGEAVVEEMNSDDLDKAWDVWQDYRAKFDLRLAQEASKTQQAKTAVADALTFSL